MRETYCDHTFHYRQVILNLPQLSQQWIHTDLNTAMPSSVMLDTHKLAE